jgi:hypothetical protein
MQASCAIVRILQAFLDPRLPPGTSIESVGKEEQCLSMLVAPKDGVDVLLV